MGLFKDMNNISEIVAEHDGMPNRPDSFVRSLRAVEDGVDRDILSSGTAAKAVVIGALSAVPDDYGAVQIGLRVHPPVGSPYPVNYVCRAAQLPAAPEIGTELAVRIAANDPQRIVVTWDGPGAA